MNPEDVESKSEDAAPVIPGAPPAPVAGSFPAEIALQDAPLEITGVPGAGTLAPHAAAVAGARVNNHVGEMIGLQNAPLEITGVPARGNGLALHAAAAAGEGQAPVEEAVQAPEDAVQVEEPTDAEAVEEVDVEARVEEPASEEAIEEEAVAFAEKIAAETRPRTVGDLRHLTVKSAAERMHEVFDGQVAALPNYHVLGHCQGLAMRCEGEAELAVEEDRLDGTLYALRSSGSPKFWIFVRKADGAAFRIFAANDAAQVAAGGSPEYWGQRLSEQG